MIKIIPDFISSQEEANLLSNLKPSRVKAGFARNKILRYGSNLPYKTAKQIPIPKWLHEVCIKVGLEWRSMGMKADLPDHVTINEYLPEQTIDWHIDSKGSGPIITVLSLESKALMGLRYPDKTEPEHIQPIQRLPERSLLHMTEKERWEMEHCIFPVEKHRWSIVFRKGTI